MGEKLSARKLSEQFQKSIMAELRNGSLSAADIAARLDHGVTSISQYLRVLEKAGWVIRVKYIHRPGRGSYRLWGINQSKLPKPEKVKKGEIGLNEFDYEWMRYWRLPRTERLLMLAESTNVENVKCPLKSLA